MLWKLRKDVKETWTFFWLTPRGGSRNVKRKTTTRNGCFIYLNVTVPVRHRDKSFSQLDCKARLRWLQESICHSSNSRRKGEISSFILVIKQAICLNGCNRYSAYGVLHYVTPPPDTNTNTNTHTHVHYEQKALYQKLHLLQTCGQCEREQS